MGRRLLREAAAEDAGAADFDTAVAAATAAAEAEERLRKRNDITTLQAAADAAAEVSQAASDAAAQHLTHLVSRESRFLLEWFGPSAGSGRSSSSEKTRRRAPSSASTDAPAPAELCHPLAPGTTLCSHPLCGRPETRRHEFRRCSCCGRVRYCSRSCQSSDWRLQHKFACLPLLELYGWIESDTESELDAEEAAAAAAEAEAEAEASEESRARGTTTRAGGGRGGGRRVMMREGGKGHMRGGNAASRGRGRERRGEVWDDGGFYMGVRDLDSKAGTRLGKERAYYKREAPRAYHRRARGRPNPDIKGEGGFEAGRVRAPTAREGRVERGTGTASYYFHTS